MEACDEKFQVRLWNHRLDTTPVYGLFIVFCVAFEAASVTGRGVCSSEEVPVPSNAPQVDRFCKPWLVLPTERYKHRWCHCKTGFVRNAWGQCISSRECYTCMNEWYADFTRCSPACPMVCGRPADRDCKTFECNTGCACAPGYVLDPWRQNTCVPVSWCSPKCPVFSTFQLCSTNCAPKCGLSRPKSCRMRCNDGECVCWPGFVKELKAGEETCIPLSQCTDKK
ncbi:uncharacterized protein LOC119164238 [Rhipicephalus microplus]|uniref:uncharacterized protein LOC119164238 n=1 Tax=Rhipicephalus microplus TaxID=6941 RepID=UPI003F6A6627